MTKSSATSQIEGKNKTIDYKKLYQEQAKKHQLMLSQISHEIRNPVTLINSFLQILEKQHPDLSEDQNWIKILENMDFLRGLLGELSSYNNSLRLNLQSSKRPKTPIRSRLAITACGWYSARYCSRIRKTRLSPRPSRISRT